MYVYVCVYRPYTCIYLCKNACTTYACIDKLMYCLLRASQNGSTDGYLTDPVRCYLRWAENVWWSVKRKIVRPYMTKVQQQERKHDGWHVLSQLLHIPTGQEIVTIADLILPRLEHRALRCMLDGVDKWCPPLKIFIKYYSFCSGTQWSVSLTFPEQYLYLATTLDDHSSTDGCCCNRNVGRSLKMELQ